MCSKVFRDNDHKKNLSEFYDQEVLKIDSL